MLVNGRSKSAALVDNKVQFETKASVCWSLKYNYCTCIAVSESKRISDMLDKVLNAIEELNTRMNSIDKKFETYNLRLNNLELKLNKKSDEINLALEEKVNESDLEEI